MPLLQNIIGIILFAGFILLIIIFASYILLPLLCIILLLSLTGKTKYTSSIIKTHILKKTKHPKKSNNSKIIDVDYTEIK